MNINGDTTVRALATEPAQPMSQQASAQASAQSVTTQALPQPAIPSRIFGWPVTQPPAQSPNMFSRLFEVLSHEQNRVITVVGISDPPPPPPAPPVQIQPVNDTKPPVSDPPVVTTPTPPAPPPPPTPAFRQSLVLPSASILKASGEMEFRPVGKAKVAAILFRKELKGDIAKVQLLSPDGTTVLSEGKNAGLSTEGKPAWRFADVGEKYPPGAIVLVTLKDGSQRYIEIPNPSKTYNY